MTPSDDLRDDMAFFSSSDRADRLISGADAPEDLADGPSRVARLLGALRTPTTPDGAREQEAVAAITSAIAASPTNLSSRSAQMPARRRTAQAAAAAFAVTLLAATGAAAATGSLPDAAQSAVSRALSHVSVDVPNPDHHAPAGDEVTSEAGAPGTPVGPDATGPAKHGLCTAWAARNRTDRDRGGSGDSVAFANLRHAAHDQDMLVKDYCADEIADDTTTTTTGEPADGATTETPGRSDESHGQSGAGHGPVGDTPNSGGIDTGSDASSGADATGASHATTTTTVSTPRDHGASTSHKP
jgi:hypothetical protein